MSLEAIKYTRGHLRILNQLLLPNQSIYEQLNTTNDGWQAIKEMKVNYSTP